MPLLDDLVEQMSSDKEETVVETTVEKEEHVETPKEEPEQVADKPNSEGNFAEERADLTKSAFDGDKPEEAKAEEKPAEQPKPDLSQVSKEEKAEHAFKRQLSKQKERHQKEIEDLKATFTKEIADLKESLKPKEPPKTRADFPLDKGGDDAYIRYLTQQGVDAALAEKAAKDAEAAKKADEEAREAREEQERNEEMTRTFGANSRAAFPDEARFQAYAKSVNKALSNGLGEVLDQAPTLKDFIFRNPEGPKCLDRMLTNREDFVKIMSQGDPTMMIIAAHEVATRADAPAQSAEPAPAPSVPHLGKPGAKAVSAEAGSVFNNDKDLIAYIRNVGNRRK